MAVGAYGLGGLLATLLGGHLADKLGRRETIALSMFSGAATMMLLSQAHSFALIIVLTVLAGLASEFYRPASSALFPRRCTSSRKARCSRGRARR